MSSSQGTDRLLGNLIQQQERLLQQLDDLVAEKDAMESEEYEESKAETLEQIIDVAASLQKLKDGNITLTGQLESQRQLTRAAISDAFRTPEVIRMFAKREPEQLRQRLTEKERDHKLGKLNNEAFQQDKRELLLALRQMGEQLSVDQEKFLSEDQTDSSHHFQRVSEETDASSALMWAKRSGALDAK